MKAWEIDFKENGEEYTGMLTVYARHIAQLDGMTIKADGVTIILDEEICEIRERATI